METPQTSLHPKICQALSLNYLWGGDKNNWKIMVSLAACPIPVLCLRTESEKCIEVKTVWMKVGYLSEAIEPLLSW